MGGKEAGSGKGFDFPFFFFFLAQGIRKGGKETEGSSQQD